MHCDASLTYGSRDSATVAAGAPSRIGGDSRGPGGTALPRMQPTKAALVRNKHNVKKPAVDDPDGEYLADYVRYSPAGRRRSTRTPGVSWNTWSTG